MHGDGIGFSFLYTVAPLDKCECKSWILLPFFLKNKTFKNITFITGMTSSFSRCRIAACEGNVSTYNQSFLNFTTPYDHSKDMWSQCSKYAFNDTSPGGELDECVERNFDHDTTTYCNEGHVFNPSLFRSSIITEVRVEGRLSLIQHEN